MEMHVEISEPAVANTAGDGVRYAPYGLFGGDDGLLHRYRLISKGRSRLLKTKERGDLWNGLSSYACVKCICKCR
jgi:N-methylhydantoinase B